MHQASREHGLTIAVIHHQTPHLLPECLRALTAAAPDARLLLIDTGEREPLPEGWTPEVAGVELLRVPNHSYAAAVNHALRACRTTLFAHMNADVIVRPETFKRLIAAVTAADAAMAGPVAVDAQGKLPRHGPAYRRLQLRARRDGVVAANWLSGCLQLVTMEAVAKVGGMDASLRFYNEDLDWCLRMRRHGLRLVLVGTEVTHLGGSSTPRDPAMLVEGLRGGYQITRRYRGPAARSVHRWGGVLICAFLGVFHRDPVMRAGYRQASAMFRGGRFDDSPFAETLGTPEQRGAS